MAENRHAVTKARVEAEYRRRTPGSAALHEAAKRVIPGGESRTAAYFSPYPLFMEQGEGCRLTDVDGNRYVDFLNNYTSQIHGHANPLITEAVSRQIAKGTAYASSVESQLRLAEEICRRVPSVELVRFANSGTEATMYAIRAAKGYTGRNKILKMEGGYHGTHDAALVSFAPSLDLAGEAESPNSVPSSGGLFKGVVDDIVVAPFNNIEATARIIERHKKDLAGVIVEPVMGGAGTVPARPEYLRFLREATEACGAMLIFDEVITFRLAYGGAQEAYDVKPDLTALGKIIGGGLPVGALGGRADLMDLFDSRRPQLYQTGTFSGNPATMVAGLASLELLTTEKIARLNELGEHMRRGLGDALAEVGIEGQVTGMGSLMAVHFIQEPVTDYRSAARADKELASLLHLSLLNRGIFTSPRGFICLSTPMEKKEVDEAIRTFTEALTGMQ